MISSASETQSTRSSSSESSELAPQTEPEANPFAVLIARKLAFIGAASQVQCAIEGDAIVLRGTLGTFYAKQQVQECVRSLQLPLSIDNRCVVEINPEWLRTR